MKEFWALVSFEYRKILGKRSVKIALLLTLFLSVFSIKLPVYTHRLSAA